ncbi:MAG: aminotransferase class I/II-fold pyridoxal phosphate-dependent enzyme, partial [Proteiniphilum sp.]|nr:aminotransferase class I/II-fold pyridoxal phosphate-dependent enzyme [Proteiniphilum sp.]
QREYLKKELDNIPIVKKIYPSDANFLLIEVDDANYTYNQLVGKCIVTRNRSTQIKNCIRITVGTAEENQKLLSELRKIN